MSFRIPWMAVLLLFLKTSTSAQRPGGFQVVGPGGGGAMFHPLVSPYDPSTVLIACDMTGSYITHDGGHSWRMFNLRDPVSFFVFDPNDRRTIYAENNNLWRSRDLGDTWTLVAPAPSTIEGIEMASDHGSETVITHGGLPVPATALVIDPTNSQHLYASAGQNGPSLYESTDAGSHWAVTAQLPEFPDHMAISATDPKTLIAIGEHFVVRRKGVAIERLPTPAPLTVSSAGITSSGVWTIYAAGPTGLFVSSDGGANWHTCALPGNGAIVRAVATSLHHPETAYASYRGLHLDGEEFHGVARTQDAGKTWTLVWKETAKAAANVEDAWLTPRFGTDWGENPLDMTVADQDPNLVYATDFGRTLISTDGGERWKAAYSKQSTDGGWTTTGLDVTTAYGIHFDPFDPRREFITFTDISLFRSETGGRSWVSSSAGIPKEWLNTTYWMVFDPEVKGRVWSVNTMTHDLPRPKMFRHTSTDTYKGGVCRSDDGGRTWSVSTTGMPPTAPTDILLDPASLTDARTLYVTAFGRGVYKSRDGGATWQLKNTGIRQPSPLAWRITFGPDRALYLVIARRSENGSIGNAGDGALYRSVDGAESWQPLPLPTGVNGPNGLAVDPSNPKRLYLAAWARSAGLHGEGGGVFISDDAGQHWTTSLDRDQHIYDVTLDPRLPKTVYASGFESSAWVSRDAGLHWARIAGFNFKWGHRVVLDPNDSNSIYITTFGGGVWHGAVTTDAAALDIATPAMDPGR